MKKTVALFSIIIILLITVIPGFADNGNVKYLSGAGNFVFEPGSTHSVTDLFPDLKDVMPGDNISQEITVKNTGDVVTDIYLRSLGSADAESENFLKQLTLIVKANGSKKLFEAAASEKAQLSDWVLLGTFLPGAQVTLNLTLNVPITLDNKFQKAIGYLDWQFKAEEFEEETTAKEVTTRETTAQEGTTKQSDTTKATKVYHYEESSTDSGRYSVKTRRVIVTKETTAKREYKWTLFPKREKKSHTVWYYDESNTFGREKKFHYKEKYVTEIITNEDGEIIEIKKTPYTGDFINGFGIFVPIIILAGAVIVVLLIKGKKEDDDE